jgi:hypothetical protein
MTNVAMKKTRSVRMLIGFEVRACGVAVPMDEPLSTTAAGSAR